MAERPSQSSAVHACNSKQLPGQAGRTAQPSVSVSIITYNQQDYIKEAIESAVSQNYDNLQVVVSDDASTDGTTAIIADYAQRFPGRVVSVFNQNNLGVTANSNVALRACSGELIAFMGGDDVLLPGKISTQVRWFEASPKRMLCGHQLEVFYDDGRPSHPLSRRLLKGIGAEQMLRQFPFGTTSVMVRADRIPSHRFDERLPVVSDQLLYVDVLRDDGEFGFVEGTFGRYRRHANNVTNDPFRNLGDVVKYLEIVADRYPELRPAVSYARTRRLHYDVGVSLMNAGRKTEARRQFLIAARREPWFAKAWVRAVQATL